MVSPTGNMYIDSRQNISLMGPPGYPHMPNMSNTAPAMTGDSPPPPTFSAFYFACYQGAAAIFSVLVMLQRRVIRMSKGILCDASASVSRPPQPAVPAAAQTPAGTLPGETHADCRRHPGRLWLGLHRLNRGLETGGQTALFHLPDKDKTDDNPTKKTHLFPLQWKWRWVQRQSFNKR